MRADVCFGRQTEEAVGGCKHARGNTPCGGSGVAGDAATVAGRGGGERGDGRWLENRGARAAAPAGGERSKCGGDDGGWSGGGGCEANHNKGEAGGG